MEELIPAMGHALVALSDGEAVQPLRTVLPVAEHGGYFFVMPAYCGALGAKLVTLYPENEGDVPTHHALVLLFRADTGEPLATMDGRLITEMRTAAVSAAATERLARRDARVLAIIGSGVQAGSHLEALRLVRDFAEVRVWSPHRAAEFARRRDRVRAARSAEEAVRDADVIVTATTATAPVLRGEWLSPGAHVVAVGACRPEWRELDDEALRRVRRIFVESREAAAQESGDVIASGRELVEMGEVFSGARPGRESPEEVTLFKSVGVAVEDVVAADLVYRKALAAGGDLINHRPIGATRRGGTP